MLGEAAWSVADCDHFDAYAQAIEIIAAQATADVNQNSGFGEAVGAVLLLSTALLGGSRWIIDWVTRLRWLHGVTICR